MVDYNNICIVRFNFFDKNNKHHFKNKHLVFFKCLDSLSIKLYCFCNNKKRRTVKINCPSFIFIRTATFLCVHLFPGFYAPGL